MSTMSEEVKSGVPSATTLYMVHRSLVRLLAFGSALLCLSHHQFGMTLTHSMTFILLRGDARVMQAPGA